VNQRRTALRDRCPGLNAALLNADFLASLQIFTNLRLAIFTLACIINVREL
jgi:hypothetical protein